MDPLTCRILRAAALAVGVATAPALPALEFSPCELVPPGGVAGPRAQCATLSVAEDRARPEGRRIELAIARIEPRRRPAQPDPLLFLAGGPGQSALESYGQVAPAFRELLADRAVVLVDQRGTGRSHPLRCDLPDSSDPTAPLPDAAMLAGLARDCLAGLDAEVAHYTTRDYLADLEAVREALGVRQWNLVGGSYGTRVALSYIQAHPERVRSAVLDGVVPQDVALGQDHGAFLDAALAAQFARCRADAACAGAFGDPAATLAELRRRYRETPTTVIIPDPRSHRPIEVALNHETLAGTVRMFAYSPEYTALLPLLLHQAREGDPQPLLAQARILFADLEDIIAHGMQLSVGCSEDAPWLNPSADDDSLIGADLVGFMRAQCSVWPVPRAPGAFKQPVDSELPVLLLSGEFDPVTPPAYAERALATLANARHLVAPGQGHIVMTRGCMPTLVARFVRAGEVAAIGDADCLDTLAPWPFYLDFNGSAP